MGGYCYLLSVLDASQVVVEAVSLEEAATKLQTFWRLHRENLPIEPPPQKKVKRSPEYTARVHIPLVWKYLRSYVDAERLSAAQLLLSGCHRSTGRGDVTSLRFSLIRILLRQMEQYVVMPRSIKSYDDYYAAPSEELAVEWTALLSELLEFNESGDAAAAVDKSSDDEEDEAINAHHPEITAAVYYIVPRIAHMILQLSIRRHKKAAGAFVQLVHSLCSVRFIKRESQRESTRDRLQFLQDRCLWQRQTSWNKGPDESHPNAAATSTTSLHGTVLSPLACLIAAYYMSHHPKLAELVDPALQGVVILQKDQQSSSSGNKQSGGKKKSTSDDDEKEAIVAVGLVPDPDDFFFFRHQAGDAVVDDDDDDDEEEEGDDEDDDGDDNKEDDDDDNDNKLDDDDDDEEEANDRNDEEIAHNNPIIPPHAPNDNHEDEVKDKTMERKVIDGTEDMESETSNNQNHDDSDNREKEESDDDNENSDSEEDEICLGVGWEHAENDEAPNSEGVGDGDSSEDPEIYDEDEDDDGEEGHDNDETDINHHHLSVVMQEDDMDLDELQAVVAAQAASQEQQMHRQPGDEKSAVSTATGAILENEEAPIERRKLFIAASMQVLELLHPHHPVQHHQNNSNSTNTRVHHLLSIRAENSLVKSINKSVKPPFKPLNFKILLRRLPSQEEFFLGSLSKNPLSLNMLRNADPTIKDLRDYIASQLQMTDSAELIEILVANKILDVNLKLRLVHSVFWKKHLIENGGNGNNIFGERTTYFSAGGSALSIIMSTSADRRNTVVTAETPPSELPPLVATYRLIGVDGEATEDIVSHLIDPDAPESLSASSLREVESSLEAEYGITRMVTLGRGVNVLLRSINCCIADVLRRIRRDDVDDSVGMQNYSRQKFKSSPPCHGLILLQMACKLNSNRKKLLQARAPTVLLTLLLEVLTVFEKSSETIKTNPTAEILQELIELLTSDIFLSKGGEEGTCSNDGYDSDDLAHDSATMPLLLESIETISLSPHLRNIIAKLLPFLTYGQADLSRELASHLETHIATESLAEFENENADEDCSKASILLKTFVQTAISLPDNEVCDSLRSELSRIGFVERLASFIIEGAPEFPPPWTPALWEKGEIPTNGNSESWNTNKEKKLLKEAWRAYYQRGGVRTAFRILTGISRKHAATQAHIARLVDFLRVAHWIEATSDAQSESIETKGIGLLAETLLDEISESNKDIVASVRRRTQLRKKEIAFEKRHKALHKMGVLGRVDGRPTKVALKLDSQKEVATGVLAPVVGLIQNASNKTTKFNSTLTVEHAQEVSRNESLAKPTWLAEAEMIEDEIGLKCVVCQEGRTLQPSELLGLYAYVKKVSIPMDQCGTRPSIEGVNLLKSLPSSLPAVFIGTLVAEEWFPVGKATAESLSVSSSTSSAMNTSNGQRSSLFTTTVAAGNGIHFTCHRKAREADRKHQKAPKSEWEGSTLRNNRVKCNIILPLVSSHSSKVSLMSVDAALTDYQAAISNLLGSSPKSMLWTVLHDVRLLLLRMAYGESLSADCGGGSISSNCQLLLYQLLLADMFLQDATVDQPEQSAHARGLSSGLLAGVALVTENDSAFSTSSALTRAIADAAPMAAITCIAFQNSFTDGDPSNDSENSRKPHPKRQWLAGRTYFLQSFLICAGRRHALGLDSSGCHTSRVNSSGRTRSSSFADWEDAEQVNTNAHNECSSQQRNLKEKHKRIRTMRPTIEDFQNSLRPLITLFAIMDQLSADLSVCMDDIEIIDSSERLARIIAECQCSRNIRELLRIANVTLDHEEIIELLQRGMVAAF